MKDCIFCRIVSGEIASDKIYEDSECLVIPDRFPSAIGQTLVIAKKHEPYAFNLDDKNYLHLFSVAKKVAIASDKAFGSDRTCLLVEGFHVPHVHLKLYPTSGKKLDFGMGNELSAEEIREITEKIRERL